MRCISVSKVNELLVRNRESTLQEQDKTMHGRTETVDAITGLQAQRKHIDDKYGIDVDEVYAVRDILPAAVKENYLATVSMSTPCAEDNIHRGYLPLQDCKVYKLLHSPKG
jgi:hypothetical protein